MSGRSSALVWVLVIGCQGESKPLIEDVPRDILFVPGGTFRSAQPTCNQDGQLVHEQNLTEYSIDRTLVTCRAYAACSRANKCPRLTRPSNCKDGYAFLRADNAASYCAFAGGQLPSWSEWLRAAIGPQRFDNPKTSAVSGHDCSHPTRAAAITDCRYLSPEGFEYLRGSPATEHLRLDACAKPAVDAARPRVVASSGAMATEMPTGDTSEAVFRCSYPLVPNASSRL